MLQPDLKLRLVNIYIVPFLIYGSNVYRNLESGSIKKLQLAMKNCARFIYDKRKYEHISQYCSNILRTTLSSFLNIRNMLIMHKVIYCKKPEYLHECLEFCKSGRTQNLVVPAINHSTTSRMFFVNAIKLWNKLRHHIKKESNYTTIKHTIYI